MITGVQRRLRFARHKRPVSIHDQLVWDYHRGVRGLLIREYWLQSQGQYGRKSDGVIVTDYPTTAVTDWALVHGDLNGHRLTVVEAKGRSLNPELLGQLLMARLMILERCRPKGHVKLVALAVNDDRGFSDYFAHHGITVRLLAPGAP